MKISVCIPTHERHALLEERTLPSLLQQTRRPDEIVVADSSTSVEVNEFYEQWAQRFRPTKFTYVRTEGRSVARNRWMAFCHSDGDVILFCDDDIQLTEKATTELCSTFAKNPDIAGVGLKIYYEGPASPRPLTKRLRDWWLNDSSGETHSVTAGGRNMFGRDRVDDKPIPVQWLTGGAMCFRREVLDAVGVLPGVDDLFGLGIGISEDAVLSRQVGLRGRLLLLTRPFAWHTERRVATSTAVITDGWRRGLRNTVGKAHALHWLAHDRDAVAAEWLRVTSISFARGAKGVLARPLTAASWLRLAGLLYGSLLTSLIWRRIPRTPQEPAPISRKWLFI